MEEKTHLDGLTWTQKIVQICLSELKAADVTTRDGLMLSQHCLQVMGAALSPYSYATAGVVAPCPAPDGDAD